MKKNASWFSGALLPALLIAALAASLAWGMKQRARAEEYFTAAGEYMASAYRVYERCANELADNISDMDASFAKLSVCASEEQTVLALEDVVRSSAASVSIMSRLPRTHPATEQLMRFLVRTGDYARCLSRRVLAGERLGEYDVSALESLYGACSELVGSLHKAIIEGEIPMDDLESGGFYEDGGQSFTPSGMKPADGSETFGEYPTLIYDGPFAESTEKAVPYGLGEGDVTEEAALETACRLAGAELSPAGVSSGRIPVYLFTGEDNGASVSAAVTVTGGRLLWFMRDIGSAGEASGEPGEEEYGALVNAASAWLESAGYESMKPSYSLCYGGAALLSFVYDLGGIKVYNDLVKVWVERGSCRVIGADANNYLFSHRERLLPEPVITEGEALALAGERLEVDSVSLALIPLSPSVEALCRELHGYCRGEEYVVYINVLNGREERIFRIVNDGTGKAAV